jgi:hypothetical protein
MTDEIQRSPSANLVELLERILDKGVVVVGDIRVAIAEIELLKIQIRLFIASVDKAKELGMDLSWVNGINSLPTNNIRSASNGRKSRGRRINVK